MIVSQSMDSEDCVVVSISVKQQDRNASDLDFELLEMLKVEEEKESPIVSN